MTKVCMRPFYGECLHVTKLVEFCLGVQMALQGFMAFWDSSKEISLGLGLGFEFSVSGLRRLKVEP